MIEIIIAVTGLTIVITLHMAIKSIQDIASELSKLEGVLFKIEQNFQRLTERKESSDGKEKAR